MMGPITKFTRICALVLIGVLAFGPHLSFAQGAKPEKGKATRKAATREKAPIKSLTEEQKIFHLLDRVTFGPRPGEVERVRQLGWERYLEEQLHPERLSDQVVEQKLQAIPSLHLTSAQLAAAYPPVQVIREALRARGIELPNPPQGLNPQNPPQPGAQGEQSGEQAKNARKIERRLDKELGEQGQTAEDEMKRRRQIQAVLQELGYKLPQQLTQELQQAKILRAVYSERQLQEVLTDFWFNHFNVFAGKGADRWLITAYERDTIRPRVFGKFEDLLRATAQSPAMLFYLDNWLSASPNAKLPERPFRLDRNRQLRPNPPLGNLRGRFGQLDRVQRRAGESGQQQQIQLPPQRRNRGLNENYAREIMELHTLGVDGGYTQKDVQEVARCFTGWTIRNPRQGGEFFFNPWLHDDGEKVVLGHKIPAGGGMKDGERVIKLLAHHPSTAKFIATKLARKFISDNPPPALIERTAQVFLKTDGDLREVVRSLLTSPEFFSAESYRAKIKTPFEMTVSAVRALGAETNGTPPFHRWMAQMGEPLFMAQPPTGYADAAEIWVNTGALLERMNFALALAAGRIPGTRVNLRRLTRGVDAAPPSQVADHLVKLLLRGEVSPQTRATLDKHLSDPQLAQMDERGMSTDVAKLIGLILGSPEFQRQ
jgi:uncharacterized protein (DUF1800 family)